MLPLRSASADLKRLIAVSQALARGLSTPLCVHTKELPSIESLRDRMTLRAVENGLLDGVHPQAAALLLTALQVSSSVDISVMSVVLTRRLFFCCRATSRLWLDQRSVGSAPTPRMHPPASTRLINSCKTSKSRMHPEIHQRRLISITTIHQLPDCFVQMAARSARWFLICRSGRASMAARWATRRCSRWSPLRRPASHPARRQHPS